MVKIIIIISSVITALSTIIGALITIYKLVNNVEKKFEKIDNNMKETNLSVLRLTIINESMPLDERVDAGEKYVNAGGNGSVHALYDVLREKYENELKRK